MTTPAANWVWTRPVSLHWIDAWVERLAFVGPQRVTVVEKPGAKFVRIEAYPETKAIGTKLLENFGGKLRHVTVASWKNKIKAEATTPLRIGKKLIILGEKPPKAAKKSPGKSPIPILHIPAGLAFGTGKHATTGMVLRELATLPAPFWNQATVLDAGTGSGILALAIRTLGAKKIEAFDYDETAIRTARENEKLNFPKAEIAWSETDILRWKPTRHSYHLIVANLFSELLVKSAKKLAQALKPGGHLLISGILKTQLPEVNAALTAAGFPEAKWKRRGRWIMARVTR